MRDPLLALVLASLAWNAEAATPPPAPTAAPPGCDLDMRFTEPREPQVASGQPFIITLSVANRGAAPCESQVVWLNRFQGQKAAGLAAVVGGMSEGARTIAALAPGATGAVRWTDRITETGYATYGIRWVSARRDEAGKPPELTLRSR
jgi:hypothetical protein